MDYQEVSKRVKEVDLVDFLEENLKRKVVLLGLVGSQLFGVEDEKSDLDFVCYFLPNAEELVEGKVVQSTVKVPEYMLPNATVTAYSANKVIAMLYKAPSDLMQVAATAKDFYAEGGLAELLDEHFSLPSAEARARNMFFYQSVNNMKPAKYSGSLNDFQATPNGVSLKAVARAYLFLSLYKVPSPYKKIKEMMKYGFADKELYQKTREGDYEFAYKSNLADLENTSKKGDELKELAVESLAQYKQEEKLLRKKLSHLLLEAVYKQS